MKPPTPQTEMPPSTQLRKAVFGGSRQIQCLLVRLALLVITSSAAHSATIAWTNTSGGNWSVAANWNPNQTPGAGDTADITNNGTYTVTLDVNATVDGVILGGASGTQTLTNGGSALTQTHASMVKPNGNIDLGGGTLSGSGLLTVSGTLNWTAGTLSGAVTVASNGVLNLSGSASKTLSAVVTNGGTIHWSGTGYLQLYNHPSIPGNNGAIHNLAGGLFDVQNDQSLATAYGYEFFDNAGTLRKSIITAGIWTRLSAVGRSFPSIKSPSPRFAAAWNFAVPEAL